LQRVPKKKWLPSNEKDGSEENGGSIQINLRKNDV
jgi:hypothetical protein